MKITGPNGPSQTASTRGARSAGAGGFSVGQSTGAASPTQSARVAASQGVGSVEALLALQETDGPLERRRRAIRRAGRLLDVMDEMKLALLAGQGAGASLQRLSRAAAEARDGTEDSGLESLLNQVDTRAAVELAKAEMSRLAA